MWTSSNDLYAQAVVPELFQNPGELKFVWARRRCTQRFNPETYDYLHIKNFRKIKKLGYSLDQVIGVDDTPEKYVKNYKSLGNY